jgi:SAM-dependent methyltransferase
MSAIDPPPPVTRPFAWKHCLDVEGQAADHYEDYVLTPIFSLEAFAPGNVLELGCAGGALGAALKARHPTAVVVGVDKGESAVQRAAGRLDRAVHADLDHFDFSRAGFPRGAIDTVIAIDLLEHLVNPWRLLEELKPWLSPQAQVLACIPNMRNITIASQLVLNGRFDYDERGLLDITHLRFFTLEGINRLFTETGYVVDERQSILLPSLEALYFANKDKASVAVRVGRMTISDVNPNEMQELCAAQFIVRARPRP